MKKRGFSLIELLVVLLGIGFILAILVSFLEVPSSKVSLTSAKSKIMNDFRIIETAWNRLVIDNATFTYTISDLNSYLKSTPTPPSNAKDSAYTGTYAYTLSNSYNIAGTSTNDYVIVLQGINQSVCQDINQEQGITNIPTSIQSGKPIQCYKPSSTYIVLYLLKAM